MKSTIMCNMNDLESIPEYFQTSMIEGRGKILDNIKALIFKENSELFDLLDFENDKIFNEPMLFAYFNSNGEGATLEQLLYGYIEEKKRPKSINSKTDGYGIIYLPLVGWIKTGFYKRDTIVFFNENFEIVSLSINGMDIPFDFSPILLEGNNLFELVLYQNSLLENHFYDSKNKNVIVEIESITINQKDHITKAFNLIKNFEPKFFELLKQSIFKVVIFEDLQVKRNSFATLSVHGCAFFNCFQKEYDEIFFVEDIAHQCGHVIFNNIIYKREELFKISSSTIIKEKGFFGMIINLLEKRTLFVAFHALFTYYTISRCLFACIMKASLSPLQKHEALGRLAFCLQKYKSDIMLMNKKNANGESVYFSEEGLKLFNPMVALHDKIYSELGSELFKINLINQPYNFSVNKFLKKNPFRY